MPVRVRSLEPTEEDVQAVIRDGLAALGYIVTVISRHRRKCWNCKKWPKGGDTVERGAPDLLVRRETWPRGLHAALEVKRPGKVRWSSLEQQMAFEAGSTWLVQSLEDALGVVENVERQAGIGVKR